MPNKKAKERKQKRRELNDYLMRNGRTPNQIRRISHRNSFWSGVYYYHDNYDDDSGAIEFENPLLNRWDFMFDVPDIETLNEFNAGSWRFKPQKKRLILFPSHLKHSISLNKSNDIRYSLAFNIVPLGVWGEGDAAYDMAWSSTKYFSNLADKG